MVSTVTVSTVTVVASSSIALAAAVLITLFLIGMLTGKELLGTSASNRSKFVGKCLTIGIVPLLLGFLVIVALKVAEILG